MGLVGKHPNKRNRVKTSESAKICRDGTGKAKPSTQQSAIYIGEMCGELRRMAKANNLAFLVHLLSMAQAEAEDAADLQR